MTTPKEASACPKKAVWGGDSGWKTEMRPILNFPYSKLNPRDGYILVCFFCLITKGQESRMLPIKNEIRKCAGMARPERDPLLQLHTSQGGVLTPRDWLAPPRAAPDGLHTLPPAASTWACLEAPWWSQALHTPGFTSFHTQTQFQGSARLPFTNQHPHLTT